MEENTGFMDKLAQLVTDFDMANFIPKLDSVIGWVELAARVAVMAGPILLLILGAVYFFIPPKEANHSLGYRFYWGMGSVEAWQFTQRIAGVGWMGVGLLLTVIMLLVCNGFRGMDTPEIVSAAGTALIWELVIIALLCVAIDVVVALRFDKNGDVRPNTVIKVPEHFLELRKAPKKK
jgi:uncharacterized membrane protein